MRQRSALKRILVLIFLTIAQQSLAAEFTPLSNVINKGACATNLSHSDHSDFKFSDEQMQEINRTIRNITELGLQIREPKVQDSFEFYLSFLKWSLKHNVADFTHGSFRKKIAKMYQMLVDAMKASHRHENEYIHANKKFVSSVLKNFYALLQRQTLPTYQELLYFADDYTLAVGIINSWKDDVWWRDTLEATWRPPEEIDVERRFTVDRYLELGPYAVVEIGFIDSINDFINVLFVPLRKVGITDELQAIDGSVKASINGYVPNYTGARRFYDHDLENHGLRAVFTYLMKIRVIGSREIVQIVNRDFKSFMTFLNNIELGLKFKFYLNGFRKTLSPVEDEALLAILFYAYHEEPNAIHDGNFQFLLESLKDALKNSWAKDAIGTTLLLRDYLVSELTRRCGEKIDMGGDLKLLQALSEKDRQTILEDMIKKILELN